MTDNTMTEDQKKGQEEINGFENNFKNIRSSFERLSHDEDCFANAKVRFREAVMWLKKSIDV